MKAFKIFGREFSTIDTLKAFALEHGINPAGNKSLKATWINAVTGHYLTAQANVIAVVVEADPIASEIATTIEIAAVSVGTVVVEVLTSETAVLVYRVALKAIAFALVMGWLVSVAAVKWCWAHRSSTAIYHWIKAALDTAAVRSALTHILINQWAIKEWVKSSRSAVRSAVQSCRVWADGVVGEVRSVVG